MRRLLLCVLGLLVLAVPASADAAVSRKKAMWGPAFKDGASQFPIYADLGVGIWQYEIAWDGVTSRRPTAPEDPSDPAYVWPAELDAALAEAARYGIATSVAIMGTPGWANGGRDRRWAPTQAADYAAFAAAAARRYPAVKYWMIWIEPTKAQNFQPLPASGGNRPLRGTARRGPQKYAQMLDGAYARIKAHQPGDLVIGGNTFTLGTVTPLRWIQALRLPNGRTPRMDLYGHNPFTLRSPDLAKPPLGNGYADFSDLDTLMRWLDRDLRARRGIKIFISEFALPTDKENYQFNFYLTRATQARWMSRALRIVRAQRRIFSFGYLALYDEAAREDDQQVRWGLIDPDGRHKPAYAAYRSG